MLLAIKDSMKSTLYQKTIAPDNKKIKAKEDFIQKLEKALNQNKQLSKVFYGPSKLGGKPSNRPIPIFKDGPIKTPLLERFVKNVDEAYKEAINKTILKDMLEEAKRDLNNLKKETIRQQEIRKTLTIIYRNGIVKPNVYPSARREDYHWELQTKFEPWGQVGERGQLVVKPETPQGKVRLLYTDHDTKLVSNVVDIGTVVKRQAALAKRKPFVFQKNDPEFIARCKGVAGRILRLTKPRAPIPIPEQSKRFSMRVFQDRVSKLPDHLGLSSVEIINLCEHELRRSKKPSQDNLYIKMVEFCEPTIHLNPEGRRKELKRIATGSEVSLRLSLPSATETKVAEHTIDEDTDVDDEPIFNEPVVVQSKITEFQKAGHDLSTLKAASQGKTAKKGGLNVDEIKKVLRLNGYLSKDLNKLSAEQVRSELAKKLPSVPALEPEDHGMQSDTGSLMSESEDESHITPGNFIAPTDSESESEKSHNEASVATDSESEASKPVAKKSTSKSEERAALRKWAKEHPETGLNGNSKSKDIKAAMKKAEELAKKAEEPAKKAEEPVKKVEKSPTPDLEKANYRDLRALARQYQIQGRGNYRNTPEDIKKLRALIKSKISKNVVEPAKKAEEPAKKAEEPAKTVVEPAKKVVEPAKKAVEPAKKVAEPVKKVAEPVKKAVDPAKKVVEPAKKAVEPKSSGESKKQEADVVPLNVHEKETNAVDSAKPLRSKSEEHVFQKGQYTLPTLRAAANGLSLSEGGLNAKEVKKVLQLNGLTSKEVRALSGEQARQALSKLLPVGLAETDVESGVDDTDSDADNLAALNSGSRLFSGPGDLTHMLANMTDDWASSEDELQVPEEEESASMDFAESSASEMKTSSGLEFAESSAVETDSANEMSDGMEFASTSDVKTSSGLEFAESSAVDTDSGVGGSSDLTYAESSDYE